MKYLFSLIVSAMPLVTLAAAPTDLKSFYALILNLVNTAVPVLFGIAFAGFLWGIGKFIRSAGSENDLEEGKQIMFWGVIGLIVMASIWGILTVARNTFFY